MTGATCFVCAKPANLRCSACAGKVEVSFCSKEHQKLVRSGRVSPSPEFPLTSARSQAWPAHKLACGERAAPFTLPPFSEYEADRAMMACQLPPSNHVQKSAQEMLKRALLPAQGMEQWDVSRGSPQSSRDFFALPISDSCAPICPVVRTDSGG